MKRFASIVLYVALFALAGCVTTETTGQVSPDAKKLSRKAEATLATLFAESPSAKILAENAKGVLVFSDIVKAGFIGGADYGKGVLKKGKKIDSYYNLVAASVGFQAGVQTYDYVLIFMNQSALDALNALDGFQVGIGPSIVAVEAGAAQTLTTSSARADVYAFIFDQKGLMGAINLEGSKITKINP